MSDGLPDFLTDEEMEQLSRNAPDFISDDEMAGFDAPEEPSTPREYMPGGGTYISAAKPDSWLGSLSKYLFGDKQSDVYLNDKGDYVQDWYNPETKNIETIPEFESQAGQRKTAQGMGMIASLVPGAGVASKLPTAATWLGRIAKNYLPAAAVTSATGIGANAISEETGDIPETSTDEKLGRFALETTLGTGIPAVADGTSKVLGAFNAPQRVARMFGATPTEMNPLRPFPVQKSIQQLEETSQPFRRGVMANPSLEKSFNNVQSRMQVVGRDIQDIYGQSGGIQAALQDIDSHPAMQELLAKATNPASVGKASDEAIKAYQEVMEPLVRLAKQGNGRIDISDLWSVRKSLDDIAELNSLNPSLSDEYLMDARVAIKDVINGAIDRAAPKQGAALKALNDEYHNLATVRQSMARGVAKTGGQLPLVDDRTPMSLAGTLGKITGIGTNTARAGTYVANKAIQGSGPALSVGVPAALEANQTTPEKALQDARSGIQSGIRAGANAVSGAVNFVNPFRVEDALSEERIPTNPQQQEFLPRDTDMFGPDQVANFLMQTAQTPQATIAQQLVVKMQKAQHAQDIDTVEKLVSDMARLFPDLFEPGVGVNGKIFYPDEQEKVMEKLRQLERMGQLDPEHLANQQNAFNNPEDGRMLPLDEKLWDKLKAPKRGGMFSGGTRVYAY